MNETCKHISRIIIVSLHLLLIFETVIASEEINYIYDPPLNSGFLINDLKLEYSQDSIFSYGNSKEQIECIEKLIDLKSREGNLKEELCFLSQILEDYPRLLSKKDKYRIQCKQLINLSKQRLKTESAALYSIVMADSTTYLPWYKYAAAYYEELLNNKEKSISYFDESVRIFEDDQDYLQVFNVKKSRAEFLFVFLDNIDSLKESLDELVELNHQKNLNQSLGMIQRLMGGYYYFKGEPTKSIKLYFEALEDTRLRGDYRENNLVLLRIGAIYTQIRDFEKANQFYNRIIENAQIHNDLRSRAIAKYYLGSLWRDFVNDHKTSESNYLEAISIFEELNDINFLILTKTSLATGYLEVKAYEKSRIILEEVQKHLITSPNFKYGAIVYHLTYGKLMVQLNRPLEAIDFCNKTLELLQHDSLADHTLVYTKDCLSDAFKLLGDYKKALKFEKDAFLTQRIFFNNSNAAKAISIAMDLFLSNQELSNQLTIQEYHALIDRQNWRYRFIAILLFISLLIGLILFILFNLKRNLNEQLQESNDKLFNSNKKLEEANLNLTHIAAIAAHDLTSPLRRISQFITLLLHKNNFSEENTKICNIIYNQSNGLSKLVNDLLTFSQIDQNLGPGKQVDIKAVLDSTIDNFSEKLESISAKLTIEGTWPRMMVHESLIFRIFVNLMGNAIKFRKNEEQLKINISSIKKGKYWETTISDNGIGFDDRFADESLKPFKRLTNQGEGSGLGLSIVHKIVGFYDGQLQLKSEKGIGTSVSFTLPEKLEFQ